MKLLQIDIGHDYNELVVTRSRTRNRRRMRGPVADESIRIIAGRCIDGEQATLLLKKGVEFLLAPDEEKKT